MVQKLRPYFIYLIPILAFGIIAWYPVLNFWFLKAFEASWLHDALPYTLTRLIRTHSFLYWIDLKLFGWNPAGWYATALLLHLIATLLLFRFSLILTKNKLLAFIASLIFVANTAYNDVLTWGSFNSYYPLLLSFMLMALTCFIQYKETKRQLYLIGSLIFTILAFYTRETGIILVPLLSLLDLTTSDKRLSRKTWLAIIKRQWPFYLALFAFLFLRSRYGGTIGDTVDSNVKMQMRLVHDKLYVEYARVTLLTFGKLIPPIIVPYPILNAWRASQMAAGNGEWLAANFFPMLGFIGYALLGVFGALFFRAKKYFRYLVFFWLWIGAFSLFISLVIPLVHEVLIRDYEVITMRYRYFAFAGAAIFYAAILTIIYEWLRKRKIVLANGVLSLILTAVVLVNLTYLRQIEKSIYESTYKAAREFHLQFRKQFPTLPNKVAFYIYPHAPNLGDNLFEWYLTKDTHYPNLKGELYYIESQIEAVVEKVKAGKLALDNIIFLDYHPSTGLSNMTSEFRTLLANQKEFTFDFKKDNNTTYNSANFTGPVIELPYDLRFNIDAAFSDTGQGSQPNSQKFRALADYAIGRKNYLDTVVLTTCRTIAQRDDEPFYYYAPEHLVDGNTGRRSSWIADAVPAWIQAELPQTQEIHAVAWGAILGSTRTPSSYVYEISQDGQTWEVVKTVKNNAKSNPIDRLDKPVRAKFIKMTIATTNSGDFAQLDEFEVITSAGKTALSFYEDRDSLLADSRELFKFLASTDDLEYAKRQGLNSLWGKLSWGTDQESHFKDSQYFYFAYPIGQAGKEVKITIPEGEIYAAVGQSLTKHYTSFALDLGNAPVITSVRDSKLVPRY